MGWMCCVGCVCDKSEKCKERENRRLKEAEKNKGQDEGGREEQGERWAGRVGKDGKSR